MNSQGALAMVSLHILTPVSHPPLVVLASHLPSFGLSFFLCETGYRNQPGICKNERQPS